MPEIVEAQVVQQGLQAFAQDILVENIVQLTRYFSLPEYPENKYRIKQVQRHGKYLFLDFEKKYLMLHLGMSGNLRCAVKYTAKKHDHLLFQLYGGKCFVFNDPRRFGRVELVPKACLVPLYTTFDSTLGLSYYNLGVDALSWSLTRDVISNRVKLWKYLFRDTKKPIKQCLLEQERIAGLGNVYACELLFRALVPPTKRVDTLSILDYTRLATALPSLLDQAYLAGGISFPGANTFLNTRGEKGTFVPDVYGRENLPCLGCQRNTIKQTIIAGRSTFWCDYCQI